ncbi:MAG: hypothetical protein SFT81_00195 [Candidatus Caenarcaniphilales bacterium]|nr:hypothetical protein [Candidatus Caenarcaniphilales bacterium]
MVAMRVRIAFGSTESQQGQTKPVTETQSSANSGASSDGVQGLKKAYDAGIRTGLNLAGVDLGSDSFESSGHNCSQSSGSTV